MQEPVYPWNRLWYPRGGLINLVDDGFLLDPESDHAKYFEGKVFSFDSISQTSCLVLLGEQGMGKSTALDDEFQRVSIAASVNGDIAMQFDLGICSSEDDLERKLFQGDEVTKWRKGNQTLHLFLDSLDEGLLRIDTISKVLRSSLKNCPTERLRLRIASRPGDWPATLEQHLMEIWDKDQVRVFELAPLTKSDVIVAAKTSEIPFEGFIDTIIKSGAVPFAIKPITLKFLIQKFKVDGTLPTNRADLYFDGCRRLSEEPNPDRNTPKLRGKLSVSQRFAIAARIAAVTQFSNKSGIWRGKLDEAPSEDVLLELLSGGMEGELANHVTVDLEALREVLAGTGFFLSRGLNRQGWRHQSYPEYLAAYYLNSHKVPFELLKKFFMNADDSGKVIPQLRETAAWLAAMNPQVFNLLLQSDPEALILTDLTSAERARLATRLLESFESGEVFDSPLHFSPKYDRLKCPELSTILEPYLGWSSSNLEARLTAVDIARHCEVKSLQKELADIALNVNEDDKLRIHAAWAIVEIGEPAAKALLRPLALGHAGEDSVDELRGYGLMAVWPENITAQEMFSNIVAPANGDHFGSYWRFLGSELLKWLKPEDMVVAVSWARQHPDEGNHWDPLPVLSSKILVKAVDHIDETGVLDALAVALFEHTELYKNIDEIDNKLASSSEEVRRKVAHAILPFAATIPNGKFNLIDASSMRATDVVWLLTELSLNSDQNTRLLIIKAIIYLLRTPPDPITFDAVWSFATSDADLGKEFTPIISEIILGSLHAKDLKTEYYRRLRVRPAKEVTSSIVPVTDCLTQILSKYGDKDFFPIYMHLQSRENSSNPEPFPGWSQFDDSAKALIIEAAKMYLKTRPPCAPGDWWKHRQLTHRMVAGYGSLHLLALESPESLDGLSLCDWGFWTRLIVASATSGNKSSRKLLVTKSEERVTDIFYSTLDEVIDGDNERHNGVSILGQLGGFWNDRLAANLNSKIVGKALKPGAFRDVLSVLLKNNDPLAKGVARSFATGELPRCDEVEGRAVYASTALVVNDPSEWKVVWPEIQKSEPFSVAVLQEIASGHEVYNFPGQLDSEDIADLCIWLADRGLEKRQDGDGHVTRTQMLADWWNSLVNTLVNKGTENSCQAIRRLIKELPKYSAGLRSSLKEAEERTRRAAWIPLTPEEVIRTATTVLPKMETTVLPKLVITLHGIRSRGEWQKELGPELLGIRNLPLDYGNFWALELLIPWCRNRKIDWFKREYERVVTEHGIVPSIIAHSFGTYIVAHAIKKYPELRFDRIIFCGSILSEDYDWVTPVKAGRVKAVLNQCGGKDIWVKLADWFVADGGQAGVLGFKTNCSSVINDIRPEFNHFNYFYALNYRENWIPFLCRDGVTPDKN